jgi:hypothetical protein
MSANIIILYTRCITAIYYFGFMEIGFSLGIIFIYFLFRNPAADERIVNRKPFRSPLVYQVFYRALYVHIMYFEKRATAYFSSRPATNTVRLPRVRIDICRLQQDGQQCDNKSVVYKRRLLRVVRFFVRRIDSVIFFFF